MRTQEQWISRSFLFILGLAGLLAGLGFSQGPGGTVKTWTGAGGTVAWSTPGNWNPPGVPGVNDSVAIPPDSGSIYIYGQISVHELVLASSVNANPNDDTKLIGLPRILIKIGPGGGYVGIGCKLCNGPPTPTGGEQVSLDTPTGVLTNWGTISASAGGSGPAGIAARDGGDVRILAASLFNYGLIEGGDGGDKQGAPGPCGASNAGNGGDVKVKLSLPGGTLGSLHGGSGGTYDNLGGFDYGRDGEDGRVSVRHGGAYVPGSTIQGSAISFNSPSTLSFQGALAGAVVADRSIRIDASVLDLGGITAGTHVFQAADVCVSGTVVLDVGVSLESLCGAASVHVGGNCASASSFELMGPVSFEAGVPQDWSMQMPQGCLNVVIGNPMVMCRGLMLEATPACPGQNLGQLDTAVQRYDSNAALRLEWEHVFMPAAPSGAQVFIVADGVPMPVCNITPTPQFEFKSIDLSFLPPTTQFVSARFQLQAPGTNPPTVLAIDNVAFRIPTVPLPGQPSQPGVALLDVNDARNANNFPLSFGAPGPFFTYVPINTVLNVHVEGPPNQTVLFATGFIIPGALQFPFGQLDLDPLSLVLINPVFPLGLPGTLDLPIFIPPPLAELTLGLQAAVTNPSQGLALTNSVEVRFGK